MMGEKDQPGDLLTIATDVLGGEEKARGWLRGTNDALGGKTPLEAAGTADGEEKVRELLLQIEHGVLH